MENMFELFEKRPSIQVMNLSQPLFSKIFNNYSRWPKLPPGQVAAGSGIDLMAKWLIFLGTHVGCP